MGAAQDLDQRAFPGAVFPQQRQHLARVKRQIYIVQGADTGEHLADPPHLQERLAGSRLRHELP